MSTLAIGLFGLRSTFRAAFADLNQYMIRELKQALIVTQRGRGGGGGRGAMPFFVLSYGEECIFV